MLDLASIRHRLATNRPARPVIDADVRQAAVAVVLRAVNGIPETLFIKRAEKDGDPWSGHMAFPGGHRDPGDADLCAAAVRETAEEIGLDISCAPVLGELPSQRPMSIRRQMLVAPFVFEIEGDPAFELNHEVAEAVWTPLAPMYHGENAERSSPPFDADAAIAGATTFSGFRLAGGHFVWGMTYRMVQTFFESLDLGYQRLPE